MKIGSLLPYPEAADLTNGDILFQQDDTSLHYAKSVLECLDAVFPGRLEKGTLGKASEVYRPHSIRLLPVGVT